MKPPQQGSPRAGPAERVLTIFAAFACTGITLVIWGNVSTYQPTWPFPALYFIEMPALTIISAVLFVRGNRAGILWLWASAGALAAFSALGMFSIGSLYVPMGLALAVAAIWDDVPCEGEWPVHMALFAAAALAQAAFMLAAVRWLD